MTTTEDLIEIAKIGELKFRPLNKKIHSPRKSDKVAQDPWKK